MESRDSDEQKTPMISVIVPNYNEEEILETCIAEIRKTMIAYNKRYEIVFVDDGSVDGSVTKLVEMAESSSDIVFVQLKRNFGQQKATLAGLRASRGDVVIPIDPDLQCPPECIPLLAEKILSGHDCAGGIRESRKDPFSKRFTSYFGAMLITRAMGRKVEDFGGIKAYSRAMVDSILQLPPDYLIVPAAAINISRKYAEVPIQHQERKHGHSKWTGLMRLEAFLDVYLTYARWPFEWIMLGGLVSLGLSALVFVGILIYKFFIASHFAGTIVFFDAFLFFTGAHFCALAMIGEIVVRIFRRKIPLAEKFDLDDIMVERVYRSKKPQEKSVEPVVAATHGDMQ